jgi:hypothetical protein
MNRSFYCASSKCEQRLCEPMLSEIESDASSEITMEMVLKVVATEATGNPPFRFIIPRDILFDVSSWNLPASFVTVDIVEGKSQTNDRFDVATLQFRDSIAFIYFRRLVRLVTDYQEIYGNRSH